MMMKQRQLYKMSKIEQNRQDRNLADFNKKIDLRQDTHAKVPP